jgi:hypothetical protein
MRKRYIQVPGTGELVPAEEYVRPGEQAHMVMPDIQPYQSMIDGTMITSRSQHRAHLRQHNCIEIGNETKHLKKYGRYEPPSGLKQELIKVVNHELYKRK